MQATITPTDFENPKFGSVLTADSISTLAEVSARRKVSITFLRKEIERGRLRAVVLAPNSHRKKVRIFYRDEIAWLESNFA